MYQAMYVRLLMFEGYMPHLVQPVLAVCPWCVFFWTWFAASVAALLCRFA